MDDAAPADDGAVVDRDLRIDDRAVADRDPASIETFWKMATPSPSVTSSPIVDERADGDVGSELAVAAIEASGEMPRGIGRRSKHFATTLAIAK